MSSRADVSGKVLVVHEPTVSFSSSVMPAVRDSLNPLASQARTPLSTSPLSDPSSLAYLWYLTADSGSRDARTVLVRMSCLSRIYNGSVENFDLVSDTSNTKRNATKLIREADLILFVYRSDKPDTLSKLPVWQRLIEERRGKLDKDSECPPAEYGLIALNHRPDNVQKLTEHSRLEYEQKLRAIRSFVVTVPDVSQADAELVSFQCGMMIVDCSRKRQGLPTTTASACPSGCDVKVKHQHLTSEDEFLGTEHTIVIVRDPNAQHSSSPGSSREGPRQAEMPSWSTMPKQIRTLVPLNVPPIVPVSVLKTPYKPIVRTPLAPGTALPANSQTTDKPTADGERSSLLVRVAKR